MPNAQGRNNRIRTSRGVRPRLGGDIDARWRNTILAALASYIDAGSIVAGAAGLTLWAKEFRLGTGAVGLIGAFSSNAISAGAGALAGGWLCDRWGRARIYQWDLLLYGFGLLWIIFAVEPWMLVVGYVFAGLAVGADVPASWTLIAETAPTHQRGRHGGAAQLLWGFAPLVVLLLALALSSLGVLGIRIIFAHLLIVALVLFRRRRQMRESSMWERATERAAPSLAGVKQLLSRAHLAPLLFLTGMYGIWNLKAGTNGFFFPYILRTVGAQSQAQAVALQAAGFALSSVGAFFVFMRLVDRTNQRRLFGIGIGLQTVAMLLFCLFPLTTTVAVGYVLINGSGGGFGPQSFFQLWSAESFPTTLRSTALGLMFAIVRIALGLWSLYVPALIKSGFQTLAWLMTGFLVTSGLLGLVFGPSNPGKALEEIPAAAG
jgi:inositol transporter-like SP family MFS transporter